MIWLAANPLKAALSALCIALALWIFAPVIGLRSQAHRAGVRIERQAETIAAQKASLEIAELSTRQCMSSLDSQNAAVAAMAAERDKAGQRAAKAMDAAEKAATRADRDIARIRSQRSDCRTSDAVRSAEL